MIPFNLAALLLVGMIALWFVALRPSSWRLRAGGYLNERCFRRAISGNQSEVETVPPTPGREVEGSHRVYRRSASTVASLVFCLWTRQTISPPRRSLPCGNHTVVGSFDCSGNSFTTVRPRSLIPLPSS